MIWVSTVIPSDTILIIITDGIPFITPNNVEQNLWCFLTIRPFGCVRSIYHSLSIFITFQHDLSERECCNEMCSPNFIDKNIPASWPEIWINPLYPIQRVIVLLQRIYCQQPPRNGQYQLQWSPGCATTAAFLWEDITSSNVFSFHLFMKEGITSVSLNVCTAGMFLLTID